MKGIYKYISVILACAMVIMLMIPTNSVMAAEQHNIYYALQEASTVLDTNEYSIKVGESVDFKFYGAPKNWREIAKCWRSSNESVASVDNKGVVTGKNQGTAYIMVDLGNTCKGRLKINVGNKVTLGTTENKNISGLYFENINGSYKLGFYGVSDWNSVKNDVTLDWRSSDNKVCKVDKNGTVTPVGTGTATVSLDIKFSNGAVIEAAPCVVKVDVTKEASNEKDLFDALGSGKYTKIVFRSNDKKVVEIPEGNYENIKLYVDAPKAEFINHGVFEDICIEKIAENTWIEKAKGNSITAIESASIKVDENASLKKIDAINASLATTDKMWINSGNTVISAEHVFGSDIYNDLRSIKIDSNGEIGFISLEVPGNISLSGAENIQLVAISNKCSVNISGDVNGSVSIVTFNKSRGTSLTASCPVKLSLSASCTLDLKKGAEGSTVSLLMGEASVSVVNNSSGKILLTKDNDDILELSSRRQFDSVTGKIKTISNSDKTSYEESVDDSDSDSTSMPSDQMPPSDSAPVF